MKKIWMISMLVCALLFAVSCGGGDDDNSDTGADTGDIAGDTGADTGDSGNNDENEPDGSKCGNKVVDEGEVCDNNAKDCKSIDPDFIGGFAICKSDCSGWDTSYCPTGSGNNDGDNNGKYNCKEYAECLNSCNTDPNYDSCRQQCFSNTSSQAANDYNNLYYCAKDNGCLNLMSDDAAYTECIFNNCYNEAAKCDMLNGSGTEADTRYNPSYGHLTLNFAVDQIATPSDQEAQQQEGSDNTFGRVDAQFAFGSYGNNASSDVIPFETDKILSSAGYRNEDGFEGVSISQTFAIQTGTQNNQPQYAMENPAVVLKIDKTAFMVGQVDVSPFNNPKALIQVLHMNWETSEVVCVHAYGEGSLNITTATGDIANHGSIAFTGEVDLYNMRNYKGYSYDQNNDACEPVD